MPITVAESKMRYDDLMHLLDAYEPQYDDWQPEPPAPYRVACGWRRSFWTRRKDLQLSTSNHERFSICRREGKNCRCSGKGYTLTVDEK